MNGYIAALKQKTKVKIALYLLEKTATCFELKLKGYRWKCFFFYYSLVWPFKVILKALHGDESERVF